MSKVYKREVCRLCNGNNFEHVLELTPTPPADSYVSADRLNEKQEVYPIDIYLCRDCGVAQLLFVIDTEEVYLNYTYETVSSPGLIQHFKEYALEIITREKPDLNGLVIDIGSNDGILLEAFKQNGMKNVLGVDPMPGMAEKAAQKGIKTLPDFFTEKYARTIKAKYGEASVITSNNLVADVDDLDDMIRGVRELMGPESIFVFESFYLLDQVKNLVWDFTYHEHFSYFTVNPIKIFFEKHEMELIDARRINTKGGSVRYKIQRKGGSRNVMPSVNELISIETEMGIQRPEIFKEYVQRIDKAKVKLVGLLNNLKSKGKSIAGYGASATSTTLIYHYGLNDYINFLVDDFTSKQNLFSPGYHIPVYHPEELYKKKPDYIIILAWRFYEPIMKNHQKYLNGGGHFIIPLPELKII